MMTAFHPLLKLALCLAWILASLMIFRLSFQIAVFWLATAMLLVDARVPLLRVMALMVPFALFGFGFLTTSVLFQAETGFAFDMAREQGGEAQVMPGLVLFFRVLACGMVSAVFALTTDPGRLIRAMILHLRLPPTVGFALLQAMHMVPDLRQETLHLRMARSIRLGRPLRRVPSLAEVADIAIPTLAYAIRRASRAALSFEARGLESGRPRTQLPQPPITRADKIGLIVGLLCLSLTSVVCGMDAT